MQAADRQAEAPMEAPAETGINWKRRLIGELAPGIRGRKRTRLLYKGRRRAGEPYRIGVTEGKNVLLFHQTGSHSTTNRPEGWKMLRLAWIEEVDVDETTDFGPAAAPEAPKEGWDEILMETKLPESRE